MGMLTSGPRNCLLPGDCRGPGQNLVAGSGRRIPHRTSVARQSARRQPRRPQNKPTAVSMSFWLAGLKSGRIWQCHWDGCYTRRLDVDTLLPGPPCRQNSPPSSVPPMRRSSFSLRLNRTLAARTATSRCFPTSGSGGPTVSALLRARAQRAALLRRLASTRHPHHQHWQDLGEARFRRSYHCCHREPERRLCNLCSSLRSPCGPQVCREHWRAGHRWSFYPR